MTISTYLSIIILNVYRLNAIVKRHRMAKWIKIKIKKLRYVYTLPYWRLTSELKTQRRLKVMKWKTYKQRKKSTHQHYHSDLMETLKILRTNKELKLILNLKYFGYLMRRANSLENTLILGRTESRRRRRQQNMK